MSNRFTPLWIFIILVVLTCLTGSETARAQTAGFTSWSMIVFSSNRSGNYELYRADGDGSHQVQITFTPEREYNPDLNRGGTQIVYERRIENNIDLYRCQADGSGVFQLTRHSSPDYDPQWSPDGTKIAFVSERDGEPEIFVINADGSEPVQLTQNGLVDISPTWSQDGQRIAWIQHTYYAGTTYYDNIWVMNADGSAAQNLTPGWTFPLQRVRWSPDGLHLAYEADVDANGAMEIGTLDLATSQSIIVYDARDANTNVRLGSWSPEGTWLIFTLHSKTSGLSYLHQIEADITPPQEHVIVAGNGTDFSPSWDTMDILPPASSVYALPRFSRFSGFPVSWSGQDAGPAGIEQFEINYRRANQSEWYQITLADPLDITTNFGSHPWGLNELGMKFYFRSRARDRSDNLEAWPTSPEGDAATTLFSWLLAGKLSDNRQTPIPGQTLITLPGALDPDPTGSDGSFEFHFGSQEGHTIQVSSSGFGALPTAQFQLLNDREISLYLPPADDLILNGGFETGLAGWRISGSILVTDTTGLAHSGNRALHLGHRCAPFCFGEAEPITESDNPTHLAIEPNGVVHAVYVEEPSGSAPAQMFYRQRLLTGAWSAPEEIASFPRSSSGYQPELLIDGLGGLHVVWVTGDGLSYLHRPAGGSWGGREVFTGEAGAQYPDTAVDPLGGVHIICYTYQVNTWERTPAGVWENPVQLAYEGHPRPGVAVGPDGTVHFIWQGVNHNALYRSQLPNGNWTATEQVFDWGSGAVDYPLRLQAGPSGELHAFVSTFSGYGLYAYRPVNGPWVQASRFPDGEGNFNLAVDRRGTVYLAGATAGSDLVYRQKTLREGLSESRSISPMPNVFSQEYFFAPNDLFHSLKNVLQSSTKSYQPAKISSQASDAQASQRVTIPLSQRKPTLAFNYQTVYVGPEFGAQFQVIISDTMTSTPVFTATNTAAWQHAWVDLGDWAGDTITITFALQQAAGSPFAIAHVDEVSVGAWMTPVLESVSPGQMSAPWAGRNLTILGENFIATPQVYLGDTLLENILWIDETTLHADLPAGLASGTYPLRVVNPGGYSSLLTEAVQLGGQIHLPYLRR